MATDFIQPQSCGFLSYLLQQADRLRRTDRYGTAENYLRACRSLRSFLGSGDIPLQEVSGDLIQEYQAYLLRRGVVRNSVSFYMRILRAGYNRAVREGRVCQTFPFQQVYTGVDRTRKRAVDEQILQEICRLRLSERPELLLARDVFLFSYFTRGMAFVDVAFLKWSDIREREIRYVRRKTGQTMFIGLEPCIEQLLRRYAAPGPDPASAGYVFPLVTSRNPETAYREYRRAIRRYNRLLREISGMLSAGIPLTSYVARHSWATVARNRQIPVGVISAGLGHTSEQTTRIYLDQLDRSVLDEANRCVISAVGEISKKEIQSGPGWHSVPD